MFIEVNRIIFADKKNNKDPIRCEKIYINSETIASFEDSKLTLQVENSDAHVNTTLIKFTDGQCWYVLENVDNIMKIFGKNKQILKG